MRGHREFNMRDTYHITRIFFLSIYLLFIWQHCSAAEYNPALCETRVGIHVCVCVCAVCPCVHTNTPFSAGHLTHFFVWIRILEPIMGRQNDECWKKTLHPACHTSESQPCLSTERGRKRETERLSYPLFSTPLLRFSPSASPSRSDQ